MSESTSEVRECRDPKKVLLRQIHKTHIPPKHFHDGSVISSKAFRPFENTKNTEMSVGDSGLITAEDFWIKYTADDLDKSIGVRGFMVSRCWDLGLKVFYSPEKGNREHMHVDFGIYDKKHYKYVSDELLEASKEFGWIHSPKYNYQPLPINP